MIAQIKGKLISKSTTEAVVDCNGVGYLVNISVMTSEKLPNKGDEVMLHTILIPREDSLNLYGFRDETERSAFRHLISISGIGAKIALGILSSVSIEELQELIISRNTAGLSKLPGIGKKTAERIILELRDRIEKIGAGLVPAALSTENAVKEETLSALMTLGYPRNTAEKSIKKALADSNDSEINAENLIKKALKFAMS